MVAATAHESLRNALRSELNRHYGRIGEIEQGLDRAEGYLGKYCRGEISIPVDVLLRCLELIEVEPGQFFSRALGTPPDSSAYLRDIMATEPSKSLARLHKAAALAALEVPPFDPTDLSGPGLAAPPRDFSPATVKLVDEMMGCTAIEQRRRLRSTKKYRTAEFTWAYLVRVVKLSYSDPKTAAKQAEVVGVDLVPEIVDLSSSERLELILKSMSVWIFASRVTDDFEQAALGAYLALALANGHRLERMRAELLRMGAFVLMDNGRYPATLHLLGEALLIWKDLGDFYEVAKIQVQRGGTLKDVGEYARAAQVLRQALDQLADERDPGAGIYRVAAIQRLARIHELVGQLDQAASWIDQAIAILPDKRTINSAKLSWQVARIQMKRRRFDLAEPRLRDALEVLIECQASECTLAALDLARVLLEQEKPREAIELAQSMAHLISSSRSNPIDQGVLAEFVRVAIEGRLTLSMVDRLEDGMKGQAKRSRAQ